MTSDPASFLPFAKPDLQAEEIDEVVAVLKSGWLTTGPRVQRFEAALKDYFGAPHVLAVSSATAGLHLAMLALGLKDGDEVITTPLTFAASLNTIVLAGGRPVLVDVDPATFNIDVGQVASAITRRTKAIMPVHFAGLPVDLDPLYALADKHGLRVVEDCAHAIHTDYKGRRLGSFGDTQVFSFHPNKNMTTGEGGVVVTRHAALAKTVATLRFHGIDRDGFIAAMKEHNIGVGLHYTAAHLFSYYRERFGYKPGDFPHAERSGASITSLPLFPTMSPAEQDRVVAAMRNVFKAARA